MFSITKSFKWEMAHKLKDSYDGKCMNIHGHSYRACIALKQSFTRKGVVTDFKRLKKFIIEPLELELDHILLLDARDNIVKVLEYNADAFKSCLHDKSSIKLLSVEPTAEHIAAYIYQEAAKRLPLISCELSLDYVIVYETETSSAKVDTGLGSGEIELKDLYE